MAELECKSPRPIPNLSAVAAPACPAWREGAIGCEPRRLFWASHRGYWGGFQGSSRPWPLWPRALVKLTHRVSCGPVRTAAQHPPLGAPGAPGCALCSGAGRRPGKRPQGQGQGQAHLHVSTHVYTGDSKYEVLRSILDENNFITTKCKRNNEVAVSV